MIHKSWKPSEYDERGGLQRLVGDFVYEDHLFIDLMIITFDHTTLD
jgi:hypothetical protein